MGFWVHKTSGEFVFSRDLTEEEYRRVFENLQNAFSSVDLDSADHGATAYVTGYECKLAEPEDVFTQIAKVAPLRLATVDVETDDNGPGRFSYQNGKFWYEPGLIVYGSATVSAIDVVVGDIVTVNSTTSATITGLATIVADGKVLIKWMAGSQSAMDWFMAADIRQATEEEAKAALAEILRW